MKVRLMSPCAKTRRETESATAAMSGKTDRPKMSSTIGHMNSQRAVASERHAPSDDVARRVNEEVKPDTYAGPPLLALSRLRLDAKARCIRCQLSLPATRRRVADLIPSVSDVLLRRGCIL